jgi:four helix bundle protein
MAIQKFEDIIAWQKYLAMEINSAFSGLRDFGFTDQIGNAIVSISSNVGEGFDRNSHFAARRFLHIAIASRSETKSLLLAADRLSYISCRQKSCLNTGNEPSI